MISPRSSATRSLRIPFWTLIHPCTMPRPSGSRAAGRRWEFSRRRLSSHRTRIHSTRQFWLRAAVLHDGSPGTATLEACLPNRARPAVTAHATPGSQGCPPKAYAAHPGSVTTRLGHLPGPLPEDPLPAPPASPFSPPRPTPRCTPPGPRAPCPGPPPPGPRIKPPSAPLS